MGRVPEKLRRTIGLAALIPVGAAVAGAAWVALGISVWLMVGYLAASAVGGLAILWSFCARCPCGGHGCGHVVPGPLARALLPHRTPGRYSATELASTGLALAVVLLVPNAWLWLSLPVLVGFWVLLMVSLVSIRATVCGGCGNEFCPGHPGG